MENKIKPEQVPDEAVEAAAMARYADQCAFASQFQDWPAWDDMAEQIRAIYRSEFRLQMVAALNAWPGTEYHADIAFPAFGYGPNGFVLPLAQVDTRTNNTPEMPDGSTIVSQITPAGWDGTLYSVASEMKRLLTSASDHGTNIDSGTMDGRAYLWVCIDGVEYFITVERSSGRSKNNPFTTENENG